MFNGYVFYRLFTDLFQVRVAKNIQRMEAFETIVDEYVKEKST